MKELLRMKCGLFVAFVFVAAIANAQGALYENNFETNAVGKVPEEFLVLDGQFTVKEDGTNKVLELPGAPLETFGVLFGPTEAADVTVSAKVFGTGKGRRFPTFAIGANGVSGYRLQVSPGKKLLELYKGDEVIKSAPFDWKSGEWTELRLQVSKAGGEMKVEGKAWPVAGEEPGWVISISDTASVPSGRASIWGSPYSDTPIKYDNLEVTKVDKK
jgi:hypothetical protein